MPKRIKSCLKNKDDFFQYDSEYQKKLLKKKFFIICLSGLKYSIKNLKIIENLHAKSVTHTPITLHSFLVIPKQNV